MKTIKKSEFKRLDPGSKFQFFREHKELYRDLKSGRKIEVPEYIVENMNGIEIVKSSYKKKKRKEKEEFEVKNVREDISLNED